jgi:hypothetical protein
MIEQSQEVQLEGTMRSYWHSPRDQGKPFLGSVIECDDGKEWVVDYCEKSLFRAFANRRVVVYGKPFKPEAGQHLIESQNLRHLQVSTLRLAEVAANAEELGVGNADCLRGRFDRAVSHTGETILSFVIQNGDRFVVANHPAGATIGGIVEVWAYLHVQPLPSTAVPPYEYLWIICPCSEAVTWDFRRRSGIGPFARGRS